MIQTDPDNDLSQSLFKFDSPDFIKALTESIEEHKEFWDAFGIEQISKQDVEGIIRTTQRRIKDEQSSL